MKNTYKLILLFVSLIFMWVISVLLNGIILWFIVINLLSLYIITTKRVDLNDVIVAVVLAFISVVSNFISGIMIILPYMASCSIFKQANNKITLVNISTKNDKLTTILLVFLVGGLLGGINVFFALSSMDVSLTFDMIWIFDGLHAGIMEEICFRMFLFALCVYITKDKPMTKIQNTICYAIMVIPHVLIHFNFATINLGSIIYLSLIYGLPFTLMQKKHSLISAIGAHAVVDIIRFITFGV